MDQRIIDLYDEYTHAPLPRRVFMERLVAMVGTTGAAQLALGLLESNYALAQIVPPSDPRLSTSMVEIAGVKAYQAVPKGMDPQAARGAIIVIHENRGLNPHLEDIARRIALEGYLAVAADLLTYMGGTPKDEDAAREMFTKIDPAKSVVSLAAIVSALKSANPSRKVGAIGFCWGGGIVNNLAVAAPNLDAGVAYYGVAPKAEDVPRIKASMMLHYGGLDARVNATAPAYEEAMKKAGVSYQKFVYDGANHAFNNDTGKERYNEAAAKLAWTRTMDFFKAKVLS
ncbi:dienelactone hydrolase family protein [Roseiarcaceae bacterium H3SJ34-1]|uniref:dienelactone hydrolase family protein n=1 Tax=Terripilifer ovatus TaxID=3032367 RepID=UPI003AB9A2C2|nr:dienelactone hydrolase family protein [Roseiarcaceae bacterium H3SJ34-1]